MERRLAAIFAADVVGYSRLIRSDEEGTLAALKAVRADVMNPLIAKHGGRVVKLMGDGMLAEFASVVDAVRAAVESQQAVAERNGSRSEDKRIVFRVGINMGDVVIEGDDIYGDGVNVAARLEGLAKPGGICVSGNVYEEVRDRTDLSFEDLGEREVKNINRPVRVWQWVADGAAGAAVTANAITADATKAGEAIPLPDKASIAVLPLDSLSVGVVGLGHAGDLLGFQDAAAPPQRHLQDRGGAGFEHAGELVLGCQALAGRDRDRGGARDPGHLLRRLGRHRFLEP